MFTSLCLEKISINFLFHVYIYICAFLYSFKVEMDSEISEKSNNSSFEDLSNLNDNELKEESADTKSEDVLDIIGNGQITKKVCEREGWTRPKTLRITFMCLCS